MNTAEKEANTQLQKKITLFAALCPYNVDIFLMCFVVIFLALECQYDLSTIKDRDMFVDVLFLIGSYVMQSMPVFFQISCLNEGCRVLGTDDAETGVPNDTIEQHMQD